jgi:peptidoglycan/LPS O-acetylase OafA/YrhL
MRTVGFSAAALLFGGTLILLIHQRRRILVNICRFPPLVWMGTISYGIYLIHLGMLDFIRQHARGFEPGGFVEALLCFIATIGAAWLSWRFFESPILRLRERFTVAPR